MSKRRIAVSAAFALGKTTRLLESKRRQANVIGRNIKRHRRPHLGLSRGLRESRLVPLPHTDARKLAPFPVFLASFRPPPGLANCLKYHLFIP